MVKLKRKRIAHRMHLCNKEAEQARESNERVTVPSDTAYNVADEMIVFAFLCSLPLIFSSLMHPIKRLRNLQTKHGLDFLKLFRQQSAANANECRLISPVFRTNEKGFPSNCPQRR